MNIRQLRNMAYALSVASVLILSGCGGCSFWGNDAIWKNWDHFKFSAYGYKSPTEKDAQQAQAQQWWGCDVPIAAPATGGAMENKN